MRTNFKLTILVFSILFTGCIGRQAYYVSPFNGLASQYRSTPLQLDSIKSASYINASISAGGDNEDGNDSKYSFSTTISRSHNFGSFQGRYGAGLTLGSYKMKPYDSIGNNESVNFKVINSNAGNYFFGGAAFEGGINIVMPTSNGEWRVLGVETNMFHEFGDYFQMRENLPDSAATVIIRKKFYGTAGLFTEFVGKSNDTRIGGKIGGGFSLSAPYNNVNDPDSYYFRQSVKYRYFTFVFHVGKDKWTSFFQATFAGKSNNAILGLNYQLGK